MKEESEYPEPPREKDQKNTIELDDEDQGSDDEDQDSNQSSFEEVENEKRDSKEDHSEPPVTMENLVKRLEIGSLDLESKQDRNSLLERVLKILLRVAVNPTQTGGEIQNRLNQIAPLLRKVQFFEVKRVHQEATSIHSGEHPDLRNWLGHLARVMYSQEINQTHHELFRIIKAVELFLRVLDPNSSSEPPSGPTTPLPEILLAKLMRAQEILENMIHPDSEDIAWVQDLVGNLPWVPRIFLRNEFDLTQVGLNAPTLKVARQLKRGKLNDLRLVSILSPISDFVLNSHPRPETKEVKTWQRDLARPRGRDILPLQRLSDLPRAIWGQPGKSPEDNIREGTAYVLARRKRVQIPAGYGKEESDRITIVLYDTSGSMWGDPARFQAGLISAFTGRALSDLAPSGRHRHRLVLVPFDHQVGVPVRVTNTQEALDIIRNYQNNLKNTGGGTDIQEALLQAMALIADAEKQSRASLAAANIVLMTDGCSSVDTGRLLQARRAISRKTPVQVLFIAINETNEELMKFAMESESIGAERGFYREFSAEQISEFLNQADHPDPEKMKGIFYSEKLGKDLPVEVNDLLNSALLDATKWTEKINAASGFQSPHHYLEELEKLKWRDDQGVERPLGNYLMQVRKLVERQFVFQDRLLLEWVVDDLMTNFERLSGVKFNELTTYEQEHLKHLVRFAASLE